jgi:hypothetical protein
MSDLLIVAMLIAPFALPALALAYWPRRRMAARPGGLYRGTPVEWPVAPPRLHPRFERLPRS